MTLATTLPSCVIAMEACCGAPHFLGRTLALYGHTIRLMSPEYVHLRNRITPLCDLKDRVALEVLGEVRFAHRGLLASNLGKKASRNLGAVHAESLIDGHC